MMLAACVSASGIVMPFSFPHLMAAPDGITEGRPNHLLDSLGFHLLVKHFQGFASAVFCM